MKTEVLQIPTRFLKRIDPSLRPKKSGKADEEGGDYDLEVQSQLKESNGLISSEENEATEASMQIEQGGAVSSPSC